MAALFADSGYWIALWNPRDSLHRQALSIADSLGASDVVTTQMVLTGLAKCVSLKLVLGIMAASAFR